MDPQWHPYPHHPHCRATSNRMWRLSFSCISFLLYQVRMSPKATEHLNLHFWNFTYCIYIYIYIYIYSSTTFFPWCYFCIFPSYWYMCFCFILFFFFFCWWLFLVLFLWLLFIWGSNWKCRLGNQMTWFQILPASLILARRFASLWLTYKTEVKIMPSLWVGKGVRTKRGQLLHWAGSSTRHVNILSKYWLSLFFHPHDCQENHAENKGQNHVLCSKSQTPRQSNDAKGVGDALERNSVTPPDSSIHLPTDGPLPRLYTSVSSFLDRSTLGHFYN